MTLNHRIAQAAIAENNGRLMAANDADTVWRVQFDNYNRLASVYDQLFGRAADLVIEGADHHTLLIYF